MWYNVDLNRWVVQLLPPLLRSRVLIAIVKAMIVPLVQLHRRFLEHRKAVGDRLDVTANVQSLEKMLNDTFFLRNRQIYIEGDGEENQKYGYFSRERQPDLYIDKEYCMWYYGEVPDSPNFTVYIPTFLCSSLDKEQDVHQGKHLSRIINLLNYYKPAGRRYGIKLYEYE